MNVYVPFTKLNIHNRVALKNAYYIKMVKDTDYPDWLNKMFLAGNPFIVVEHDVVPHQNAIQNLIKCPHDWCAFGYSEDDDFYSTGTPYFGCVKFGKKLIEKNRDVWQKMENKIWSLVDVHFHAYAKRQFTCHQHYPPVKHIKVEIPFG